MNGDKAWMLALGFGFAGFVVSALWAIFWHFDERADTMQFDLHKACLRSRVIEELHCRGLKDLEKRVLGVEVTDCPLAPRFPVLMFCPTLEQHGPASE